MPTTYHSCSLTYTLSYISVTPSSYVLNSGGMQLYATGHWITGPAQDLTSKVTWYSSNTNVASVANGGYVTRVGPGSTVIYASAAGFSGGCTITSYDPPTITSNPVNVSAYVGYTSTFSVSVSGSAPLYYQWYRNGSAISGATNSYYTIGYDQLSDSGSTFYVVVSNPAGSATSSAATLTVTVAGVAPTITDQPTNSTELSPTSCQTSVGASGTAPLSYQWYDTSWNPLGTNSSSLTWYSLRSTYIIVFCVVSNAYGSVQSNDAILIQTQPNSCPFDGGCSFDGCTFDGSVCPVDNPGCPGDSIIIPYN